MTKVQMFLFKKYSLFWNIFLKQEPTRIETKLWRKFFSIPEAIPETSGSLHFKFKKEILTCNRRNNLKDLPGHIGCSLRASGSFGWLPWLSVVCSFSGPPRATLIYNNNARKIKKDRGALWGFGGIALLLVWVGLVGAGLPGAASISVIKLSQI